MRSVKFLQRMVPYAPGDIAGFEDHIADRMIEIGVAEPYNHPAEAVEAPSEPSAPAAAEIPANWATLSNSKIKRLAAAIGAAVTSRDEAISAIEAELIRRDKAK